MCNYCGCREFPLIGRLSAEHEAIANAAGLLRGAVRASGPDALVALDALLALLMPHTSTEEDGLFVELRAEGSLAEAVAKLCAEHDDIHGVLGARRPGRPGLARSAGRPGPAPPAHRQRGARSLPGRGDRAADPGLGPDHPGGGGGQVSRPGCRPLPTPPRGYRRCASVVLTGTVSPRS